MGDHFDVVEALLRLPSIIYDGAVDSSDRLNFMASCILLIISSLVITLREYLMDSISCFLATSPGGENLLKYVENYCWTEGTMTITNHHAIPQSEAEWDKYQDSRMVYYQWVPFMLLIQSGMFHVPHIFWNVICFNFCGTNICNLIKDDNGYVEMAPEDVARESTETSGPRSFKKTKYSATSIAMLQLFIQHRDYQTLANGSGGTVYKLKKKLRDKGCVWPSKRFNSWITFLYLVTKLLYVGNCVGQIFLMQTFLQLDSAAHMGGGSTYSGWFGLEILHDLAQGKRWPQTGAFPRAAYCMVRVTQVGGVRNTQVAECVLTANLFIEKIYIFLWFWTVLVAIITTGSILVWLGRLAWQMRTLRKYLLLQGHHPDGLTLRQFCSELLGMDGLFLVHMVALNRGDVVAGPLVGELYHMWRLLSPPVTTKDRHITILPPSGDWHCGGSVKAAAGSTGLSQEACELLKLVLL